MIPALIESEEKAETPVFRHFLNAPTMHEAQEGGKCDVRLW
jgi:hypothetical protein